MKVVYGDLIEAAVRGDVDMIIHQCNCFCNMGAGIAPKIAKQFPGALKVDKETVSGDETKLGTYTLHQCPETGVIVVNLYGQYHWRRHPSGVMNTDYFAISNGLRKLRSDVLDSNPNIKIGVPKIGCGLGGGSWDVVSFIIDRELENLDVTLYLLDV